MKTKKQIKKLSAKEQERYIRESGEYLHKQAIFMIHMRALILDQEKLLNQFSKYFPVYPKTSKRLGKHSIAIDIYNEFQKEYVKVFNKFWTKWD